MFFVLFTFLFRLRRRLLFFILFFRRKWSNLYVRWNLIIIYFSVCVAKRTTQAQGQSRTEQAWAFQQLVYQEEMPIYTCIYNCIRFYLSYFIQQTNKQNMSTSSSVSILSFALVLFCFVRIFYFLHLTKTTTTKQSCLLACLLISYVYLYRIDTSTYDSIIYFLCLSRSRYISICKSCLFARTNTPNQMWPRRKKPPFPSILTTKLYK